MCCISELCCEREVQLNQPSESLEIITYPYHLLCSDNVILKHCTEACSCNITELIVHDHYSIIIMSSDDHCSSD